MLGDLSMKYETGKSPGQYVEASKTVSSGKNDPGGRSYGAYQLASKTGTLKSFFQVEGKRWEKEFAGLDPASDEYKAKWQEIAQRDGAVFFQAQHEFIERTHYREVVRKVHKSSGIDMDKRSDAVRNAVWSMSVQHGGAKNLIEKSLKKLKEEGREGDDLAVLEQLYKDRLDYIESNPKLNELAKEGIRKRYKSELDQAKKMAENQGLKPKMIVRGPAHAPAVKKRHGASGSW